jgi:hypothetical protein
MAGLRFTDLQSRPTEFLDLTSLTLEEFQRLVPPFETAFQGISSIIRGVKARVLEGCHDQRKRA